MTFVEFVSATRRLINSSDDKGYIEQGKDTCITISNDSEDVEIKMRTEIFNKYFKYLFSNKTNRD